MTVLVLVRHGETTGESSIRLNGITDVPLDDVGRCQMQQAAGALAGEPFDEVLASPLLRSREGARIVGGPDRPAPRIVEAFREIDFGAFEGLTHDEAAAAHPEAYARWASQGPAFRFPGGERRLDFHQRVAGGARREFASPDATRLAVLHKGVIKAIVGELVGLAFSRVSALPVDLGGIYRLRHVDGAWTLVDTNVTTHLR